MDYFSLMNYQLVFPVLSLLHLTHADDNVVCSTEYMTKEEDACFATYHLSEVFAYGIPAPIHLSYSNTSMLNLCGNLSEISKCLEKVMTPCQNPYYDFESYRTTLSEICSKRSMLQLAELYCPVDEVLGSCMKKYKLEVQNLKYHIYLNRTVPIEDLCGVLQRTRMCLQFNVTDECTGEYAHFISALYNGRFTPSICSQNYIKSAASVSPVSSFSSFLIVFIVLAIFSIPYHIRT